MIHKLKCWPEFFQPTIDGFKNFEIRENDRKFKVNDLLLLEEWKPQGYDPDCEVHHYIMPDGKCTCGKIGKYTGRKYKVRITYITDFCQENTYVVMAIKPFNLKR